MIHRAHRLPEHKGAVLDVILDGDLSYAKHGPFRNELARGGPPSAAAIRASLPPAWDQGPWESCSVHALAVPILLAAGTMPSRAQMYDRSREEEGTLGQNVAIHLQTAVNRLKRFGVVSENNWPYSPDHGVIGIFEFLNVRQDFRAYRVDLKDDAQLHACLGSGHPICVIMELFESVDSDEVEASGLLKMPEPGETMIGYHYVALTGGGEGGTSWEFRNSWGVGWGQAGYGRLPEGYLRNHAAQGVTFRGLGAKPLTK